ncbi:MAG TPA: FKBP-type peptidyl-prolyl cis-trans isomerase [Cyclobacteriaceae bacterium]|jgi:FKBP-type peptidyl-prolyl cis-trans isomerase|nr:FKBP-type peptidyl-prolyl cis-trans isomerase [Cyclobacteriaceae bacterium]
MKDKKGNMGVIVSFVIVACFVVGMVYLMMHQTETANTQTTNIPTGTQPTDTTTPTTKPQEQQSASQQPMQSSERKLEGFTPVASVPTLQKIDLKVGTGAEVQPGATVSVQYTGAVASTGVIFQSSKDFGSDPVTFPLSGVIKGWTDGIPGMKVGGTRRLIIPAAQAYGANPPAGSGIPANADLVFDVELVAIK